MGIRIDGLDDLEKKLTTIAKQFPSERDKFLRQEAELMRGRAVKNTPVDQGRLKGAWGKTQPANGAVEIYNNTEYAADVEWGHRQHKCWVPGAWKGGRFVYDPNAKTGMMLKEKFIEGAKMLHTAMDETKAEIRGDAKRILGGLLT